MQDITGASKRLDRLRSSSRSPSMAGGGGSSDSKMRSPQPNIYTNLMDMKTIEKDGSSEEEEGSPKTITLEKPLIRDFGLVR